MSKEYLNSSKLGIIHILDYSLNEINKSYNACKETGSYMHASAAESKKSYIIWDKISVEKITILLSQFNI